MFVEFPGHTHLYCNYLVVFGPDFVVQKPGPPYYHGPNSSVINIYMLTEDTVKSIIQLVGYHPGLRYTPSIDSYSLEFLSGFQCKHDLHTVTILNGDFIFSR